MQLKNKLKLNDYIEKVLLEHLNFKLESKSVLPQILKDSKGEIVETIICNKISNNEYKNNLPKEITLLRTVGESGYMATYKQI